VSTWSSIFSKLSRSDPEGFTNKGDFADDASASEDVQNDEKLNGCRVWIKYCNEAGEVSERWVQILRIESRLYADYLFAHCELRDEIRSFRIDRIIEVADRYGETHEPKEFFAPFISAPQYRSAGPSRHSSFGRALKILDLVGQELIILAFAAECDGKFVPREANLITSYAKIRCEELGLTMTEADSHDLRKWMKMQRPDIKNVINAVHQVARKGQTSADEIVELTNLVFEADKKIVPSETSTAEVLQQLLREEFASYASS
jgi:WYL domain